MVLVGKESLQHPPLTPCRPAETQRAPDKPFIKLEASSSGTVILGFSSLDDRNLVVDVLVAQVPPPSLTVRCPSLSSAALLLHGIHALHGLGAVCLLYLVSSGDAAVPPRTCFQGLQLYRLVPASLA